MSLEDWLLNLVQSSEIAPITAFILGIVTSISPCPLASNIATIAYISKQWNNIKETIFASFLYICGRVLTYTLIGTTLMFAGTQASQIALPLQIWGNRLLGPVLIFGGLILADIIHFNFSTENAFSEKLKQKALSMGTLGSFFLGILFALAFCPYSAAFFFALLIPLAMKTKGGFLLPSIFGIGSALPVAIFAVLFSLGFKSVNQTVKKITLIEIIVRKITAFLFIVLGLYYLNISLG